MDSQVNGGEQLGPIDRSRQQDRPDVVAARAQLAQRFETRHARHRQIEQQKGRPDRPHDSDGLFTAPGFPHDLEARADIHAVHVFDDRGRHGEQLTQARPEEALVIRQHDADRAIGSTRRARTSAGARVQVNAMVSAPGNWPCP